MVAVNEGSPTHLRASYLTWDSAITLCGLQVNRVLSHPIAWFQDLTRVCGNCQRILVGQASRRSKIWQRRRGKTSTARSAVTS